MTAHLAVVVWLYARNLVTCKSLAAGKQMSGQDNVQLRYRVYNGAVEFVTNGYFFQEGQERTFQPARYDKFHLDLHRELLLKALCDNELNELGPGRAEHCKDETMLSHCAATGDSERSAGPVLSRNDET